MFTKYSGNDIESLQYGVKYVYDIILNMIF